jgi:threonine synthase
MDFFFQYGQLDLHLDTKPAISWFMISAPITYTSTRGQSPELGFADILLAGLAPDGGLYVPSHLPHFSPSELVSMAHLPYTELARRIIAPFIGDALPEARLKDLLDESYAAFRHPAIAPLKQLGHNQYLLELFHGPTLAFKDFALQFLGRLMDEILKTRNQRLVILGATSGDTGSAAIAGCQGRAQMDIVILYPHGRVSEVQRRQMTTVSDNNVYCLAVDGTFDDCQNLVKTLFVDAPFRANHPLGAVNSINWTRIIAQIVYYFYAAFQLGAPERKLAFSVPTGNFGDIYAGYLAKQMGLPIETLIIASNRNDILTRCLTSGEYRVSEVLQTLSPSMDIGISSNFERLLYDMHGKDAVKIAALMGSLKQSGGFTLEANVLERLQREFKAVRVDDTATTATIRRLYEQTGELLDPHTAVGIAATKAVMRQDDTAYVTLATAHPAKFPDAVHAATGQHPPLPAHMADLFSRPERFTHIPNDADALKAVIAGL